MAKDILKLAAEIFKFLGLCGVSLALVWFIIVAAGTIIK